MSKQYIHIETSYESFQPDSTQDELHDFIIEVNYPENLALFETPCKDRNVINQKPQACEMIASWLRLFGVFTILDQNPTRAIELCLSDGGNLVIDGWDLLDEDRKNRLIKNNEPDPNYDEEDDPVKFIYQYTDRLELDLINENTPLDILVATRHSSDNNYDLVLRPIFDPKKTYSHYTGTYDGDETIIHLFASDIALLPSVAVTNSFGGIGITLNALEFIKNSDDAMCTETAAFHSDVQVDITSSIGSTIVMDYTELQTVHINQSVFAFYGNDPRF